MAKHDTEGREILDDTPVEVPLRFRHVRVSRVDELRSLLDRVREDQERDDPMFGDDGEEAELGDLPTQYELNHQIEEESLTFVTNAERMIARRKSGAQPKEKADVHEGGTEGVVDGDARPHASGEARGRKRDDSGREGSVRKRVRESAVGDVED